MEKMGYGKRIASFLAGIILPVCALAQPSLSVRFGGSAVCLDQREATIAGKTLDGTVMAGSFPVCPTFNAKIGWYDTSGSVFSSLYRQPQYGIGTSVEFLDLCRYTKTDRNAVSDRGGYLSNIYNIYGFVDRPMVRTDRMNFQYTLELGPGFSTGIWDPQTNVSNQVMGSVMTIHVGLGLEALFALRDRSEVGVGLYYIHNSNGSTCLPNRGYNGIEIAANYKINCRRRPVPAAAGALRDTSRARMALSPRTTYGKGFSIDAYASGSMSAITNEHYLEGCKGCPVYPRFAFGADVTYRYARRFSSGVGVDVFWTPESLTAKLEEVNGALFETEVDYAPVSVGLAAIQEFHYRNLSFRLGLGAYAYNRDGFNYRHLAYQTIALRYYVPRAGNMFVGIGLKTHRFTMADCLQLTLGVRI